MDTITKPKVQKKSAIIFMVCGKELLMQEMEHQGGKIYDVFGSFIAPGDDPQVVINAKVEENIGAGYQAVPFGEVLDHIEKPEENVDLHTPVYRIELNADQKNAYQLKDKQLWASRAFIAENQHIRHGDRLIFTRALENRHLDVELTETQLEKWIDAKLISWEDR